MTLYDYTYIDEKIIGAIEKNLPNVAEILKTVEKRATGKAVSALSQSSVSEAGDMNRLGDTGGFSQADEEPRQKKITEPQPFNLTKPKPKVLPQPEPIKKEIKANPVPKNIFKKTLADIEKEKEERRKAKVDAVRSQYEGNDKKRFALQTETRPQKVSKVAQEMIKEYEKDLTFKPKHAREMPDFDKNEAVVKLNTAAVIREAALLKKKEE